MHKKQLYLTKKQEQIVKNEKNAYPTSKERLGRTQAAALRLTFGQTFCQGLTDRCRSKISFFDYFSSNSIFICAASSLRCFSISD